MSGIRKLLTPLKLATAYLLFIIVYLIGCSINDPSVVGWSYLFGMALFFSDLPNGRANGSGSKKESNQNAD